MSTSGELPPPDDRRALLRAADADRELVHEILSAAMANGNLSPDEYEERAGKALMAKTFGDLDELTDDLPVAQLGVVMPSWSAVGDRPPAVAGTRVNSASSRRPTHHSFALMAASEVKGNAVVDDSLTATAIMGGVEIDLRAAEFTSGQLTIRCFALMGGIDIVVPDDVTVEISGMAVMGGFSKRADGQGAPGAPSIRVVGFALMGGVDVKRKAREED